MECGCHIFRALICLCLFVTTQIIGFSSIFLASVLFSPFLRVHVACIRSHASSSRIKSILNFYLLRSVVYLLPFPLTKAVNVPMIGFR